MNKILLPFIFLLNFNCSFETTTTIGIQPYDNFDKSLIDTIVNTITDVYGFRVIVLPDKSIPKNAFVNIKSPRYRADTLLRILKQTKPDSIDYIIGLTHKDISTTKRMVPEILKNLNTNIGIGEFSDWGIVRARVA
ncbi:MAG: hypothetical protein HC831_03520 [Chloroflexia bacterium]|nr:hypothetical protein [Chloroflexia bacterium]